MSVGVKCSRCSGAIVTFSAVVDGISPPPSGFQSGGCHVEVIQLFLPLPCCHETYRLLLHTLTAAGITVKDGTTPPK